MTDEEKAEEILQTKGSMTFCAKGCGYTEKVKELIAIGLAEGRKETEAHLLDNWCRNKKDYCPHLNQLEKENKMCEEIIIGEQQEINRLEKEKCELLGIIQGKDEVIAELKMKLLTLENKKQIVTTTVSN